MLNLYEIARESAYHQLITTYKTLVRQMGEQASHEQEFQALILSLNHELCMVASDFCKRNSCLFRKSEEKLARALINAELLLASDKFCAALIP